MHIVGAAGGSSTEITGAPTAAVGQTHVSVEAAVAALPSSEWNLEVAEERARAAGAGVDAVICARRIA